MNDKVIGFISPKIRCSVCKEGVWWDYAMDMLLLGESNLCAKHALIWEQIGTRELLKRDLHKASRNSANQAGNRIRK